MGLTKKQIDEIRKELDTSFNPLFFFDDDPDGLSSFLLLYRYVREGHGIVVKATPDLREEFARKVEEYMPDKVFILDKPDVSQDFIDKVKVNIIWIDHHYPVKRQGVRYYNPRCKSKADYKPTSYWCYKVVNKDLWIAMAGIIGDWYIPKFRTKFCEQFPDLLPKNIKKPEEALYKARIGDLARVFSFIMKGKTIEAMQAIKVLTRINSPYEILDQTSAQGNYIYKRYLRIKQIYDELLEEAKKEGKKRDKLLVYTYTDVKMSFTGDLSNELLYLYPKKVIIVGRLKSGEMKCSLRSSKVKILPVLQKALEGIDGYGGGHDYACGACIKKKDWDRFLESFRKLLK